MVAPSRLEKSEQPANVATHNPATTQRAARHGEEGCAESMTGTIILIQKSIQPEQLERDRSIWSIQSVWSVSCGSSNKTNSTPAQPIDRIDQTDQIDLTNQPVRAFHGPRLVIDSPTPLG